MLPQPLRWLATSCFSSDYGVARDRLLAAVRRVDQPARLHSYAHPEPGPRGEQLALDVVWIGNPDAPRVLVTGSACHGVEGFCGAAIQLDSLGWLDEQALPAGVAVLHLHAINPWGFAWLRRTDHQGIDVNRNFVDFARPLPVNQGYWELAGALVPESLDAAAMARAQATLDDYVHRHGQQALEIAVSGGQYSHPEGLFYGGTEPCWSRQALEQIHHDFGLAGREMTAVLDWHTGLGPYGYAEVICDHPPGSTSTGLAKRWFGDAVTEPLLGTSASVPKTGLMDFFWHERLGNAGCFVTLEFGTYSLPQLFAVLRADHWLHGSGTAPDAAEYRRIKAQLRKHFYPDVEDWQQMVLFRGRQAMMQALRGLYGG